MLDLLIGRAISGLSPAETTCLTDFQADAKIEDDRSFDYTIAMIDVALAQQDNEQLPNHLYANILKSAKPSAPPIADITPPSNDLVKPTKSMGAREMIAWLALAASVALACFLWLNNNQPSGTLSIAELETTPDLKRIELQPTDDPSAGQFESAEILWSDSLQQGYARYRGLAVNKPSVEQYQLWIIDRDRGFEQRVDGGVFDITYEASRLDKAAPYEVTIPIRAKLNISDAKGFAVTREPPGGVVVSDLKRVALISEQAAD